MERYCDDRSAEYEWRRMRAGNSEADKQCVLYGSPELASAWARRSQVFHTEFFGGVMAQYPRHGWSFIRIPGMEGYGVVGLTVANKLVCVRWVHIKTKARGRQIIMVNQ